MKKTQVYQKDLYECNNNITMLKENISFLKMFIVDYESDETYKQSMLQLGQLLYVKSWLENKLQK